MPRATTLSEREPSDQSDAVLVSTKETARLLGLSRNHVYELLDQGAIDSRYIGRRRLVVMTSLREFISGLPAERGA
ncbi:helix-turn-helix domain-containing protein [Kribbella sp. WER1]|uniref:helix-turn-helix domain-containing protein n=1 Tax=Kribbella sp. NPDC059898 TaxID=3346995 RepID=UPI00365A7157